MKTFNILIVDDDSAIRSEGSELLSGMGYNVKTASSIKEATNIHKNWDIDFIFLDLQLAGENGLDLLKRIPADEEETAIIIISGEGTMDQAIEAMRLGATDFLRKPLSCKSLVNAITRSWLYQSQEQESMRKEEEAEGLNIQLSRLIGHKVLGNSREMKDVYLMMKRVAQTNNTSVFISGESGSGKELVAKGIHFLSNRHDQPFYSVNCSAYPDTLFESEFFGHTKGAYTGATSEKKGIFEYANKGSLFLDEVTEMPFNVQAKFLRVLEDRMVKKVGSTLKSPIDVRIISSTNRDIKDLIKNKGFRADLYYRLNTFEIHVPALRERPEDIPALFKYFMGHYATCMGKESPSIDKKVFDFLSNYSFPGNVRELRNIAERAMIICDDERFSIKHITSIMDEPEKDLSEDNTIKANFNLEEMEKMTICQALKRTSYNKSKAANLLHITRQALDRRIAKYSIL